MDPITLPRAEWVRMYRAITAAAETRHDLRFGAVLAKWRRQLEPQNELVLEQNRDAQRQQRLLQEEHAQQVDGVPVTDERGAYVIAAERKSVFNAAIDEINEGLRAFMQEPVTLTEMTMPWSWAPNDLAAGQVDGLFPLFTGEVPEPVAKKK